MHIFKKDKKYFCHLKMEIASAIPPSNDEKYNSAVQMLTWLMFD